MTFVMMLYVILCVKSFIVHFLTFCHCTAIYRAQSSKGNRVQVGLDLTKRQYDILKAGNEYINSIYRTEKFCYVDVKYGMKF